MEQPGRWRRSDGSPAYQVPPKSTANRFRQAFCCTYLIDQLRDSSTATPRLTSPLLPTPSPTPFLSVRRKHVFDDTVCGLNGSARLVPLAVEETPSAPELTIWTAKPATALMPFRAGSAAFLSSSSSDRATMKTPATIPGNPGTPPPMKSARVEVPLPSQEGKKGAMQYALYVTRHRDYGRDMGGNKNTTRA